MLISYNHEKGAKLMKRKLFYISVDEAVKKMMTTAHMEPDFEPVPTSEAYERVLAEDIEAPMSLPPKNSSHFDGYAIRFEDTLQASVARPVFLRVIGRLYPGEKAVHKVNPGEAYYITTGAFLPEGADTVIAVEATAIVEKDIIRVNTTARPSEHVIPAGKDVKKGETVLKKGYALRAQDIGLLLALRISEVKVAKRPIVAIISTGDELTDWVEETESIRVANSHSLVVAKLVMEAGGIPVELGIAPDNVMKIKEKVDEGLKKADIILIIGGSSAGEKDFVPRVIDSMGEPGVIIHGIKRKPGRVSGLGVINGKPIVMLPGLIQSTIVGFHVFALPLIRLASGLSTTNSLLSIRAKIAEEVSFKSFTPFQQVTFVKIKRVQDGFMAEPVIGESNLLSVPVKANGFIVTPEHRLIIRAGEEVEVHWIPGLFPLSMIEE
jgi:molybdopterin molybdotransferase